MAPSSSSPQAERLFAELANDPGNLGLRSVIADALQAAGDPRGELIALQLSDEPEAKQRAAELLAVHRASWLAWVPGVVVRSRFERGFLAALRVNASSDEVTRAMGRPEWATIEELSVDRYVPLAPLVGRMPLLRVLCVHADSALAEVEASGPHPSIRVLGRAAWMPNDRAAFPNLAVVARTARSSAAFDQRRARKLALQAIAFLGVAPDMLPAIFGGRGDGPPETRVLIAEARQGFFDGNGWRMRVFRDAPRATIEYVAGDGANPTAFPVIYDALRNAGIRELDVRIDPSVQAWFDVRSRGVTVRTDGPGVDLASAR